MNYLFRTWLPYALILTLLAGLIYAVSQHMLRQDANDPQIQLAEDAARTLETGTPHTAAMASTTNPVDIRKSLAPFMVIYDDHGVTVLRSGADAPTPPSGVFDYARSYGENKFTWQPERGVRIATILVHYGGISPGFVLAGRSLREVEKRESELASETIIGWLVGLVLSFGAVWISPR